jgi:hypothetical protein
VDFSPPKAPPISAPEVPMLTFTMPARAGSRHEALGLALVQGEDARGQPLRHVIVHGKGLVQVPIGQRVQQRGKGLPGRTIAVCCGIRINAGRTNQPPRSAAWRSPPTTRRLPALGAGLGDGVLHALVGRPRR